MNIDMIKSIKNVYIRNRIHLSTWNTFEIKMQRMTVLLNCHCISIGNEGVNRKIDNYTEDRTRSVILTSGHFFLFCNESRSGMLRMVLSLLYSVRNVIFMKKVDLTVRVISRTTSVFFIMRVKTFRYPSFLCVWFLNFLQSIDSSFKYFLFFHLLFDNSL